MTVPTTTSSIVYTATGSSSVYPYTWQLARSSDLIVYVTAPGGVSITRLVETTDYVVSGVGIFTGGNVTLTAGNLTAGNRLFIASDPEEIQEVLLEQGAAFNPADLMAALDLLTREVQANRRLVNNAIQAPVAESLNGGVTTLVAAAARANKFLAFDGSGNAYVTAASIATTTIPAINLTQAVDTIAALKALTAPVTALVYTVRGYYSVDDGGGGLFVFNIGDASADNGGTVIAPNSGSGRWNRMWSGRLESKWFGAKHDGTTNDSAACQTMIATGLDCRFSTGGTLKLTAGLQILARYQQVDMSGAKIVSMGAPISMQALDIVLDSPHYEGADALLNGVIVIGSATDGTKTSRTWTIRNPKIHASAALYGVVVANGSFLGNIYGGVIGTTGGSPVANSRGLFLGDQVQTVNCWGTSIVGWESQVEMRGNDGIGFYQCDLGDGAVAGYYVYMNAIPAGGDPSPFGNNVYPNGEGAWWGVPTQTITNFTMSGCYTELSDIAVYTKTGLQLKGAVFTSNLLGTNNASPNAKVGTRIFKCDIPSEGVSFIGNNALLPDYVFQLNSSFVVGLLSFNNSWEDVGRGTGHVGVLAVGSGFDRLTAMEYDSVTQGMYLANTRGLRVGTEVDPQGTNRFCTKVFTGLNVNQTNTDLVTMVMPAKFRLNRIVFYDASISLTTCAIELRSATGGGGTSLLATSSLAACTAATKLASLAFTGVALTDYLTTTVTVRVTTAQGAPATVSVLLEYENMA